MGQGYIKEVFMKIQPFVIGIAILLLMAAPASAEMYHWVDESGTNHYANSPPPVGVKAESSWPEIQYNAAADEAQAEQLRRFIKASEDQEAVDEKTRKAKISAHEPLLNAKRSALKTKQKMLANDILSDRYNFRTKAEPLIYKLRRIDRNIAASEAEGKDVAQLEAQRRVIWDNLFTERYVIREGHSPMMRYRSVSKTIRNLK
jgi:hypothetical protein